MFVGNIVVDVAEAAKKPERASAVQTFVERTAILRESGVASLDALVIATLGESGHDVLPQAVATADPAALTVAEATAIGRGFDAIIRVSASPSDAVDELLRKYPAVDVAAQQHSWARPMLETIAKRRLASAPFGLKLRLMIGVGLSMADMLSDVNSIVNMLQSGQAIGAYIMIGLISAHLAVQLLCAFIQNKHLGGHAVAWESFLVLSLAKPGADAIRVAAGAEHITGAPLSPSQEMFCGKLVEIALESGPGAAVQAYVVLSGHWSTAAAVSVGVSCLSTAFTTALMSFDLDISPEKRKLDPSFYGYIPDEWRLLVFVELFTLYTAHAMLKTLTIAILARLNGRWLVAYMAADHFVFIIYKIARGDLVYKVPGPARATQLLSLCHFGMLSSAGTIGLGVPLSLLGRFVFKVVLDCTGFLQFRHPHAAGGFYYCFNALTMHMACFVAAALYSAYATGIAPDDESHSAAGGNYTGANTTNTTAANNSAPLPANATAGALSGKIDNFTLFATIITLSVVWIIASVGLLLTMNRKYAVTFLSLQTGCAYSRGVFLNNPGDDARRVEIFFLNERHWRSIRDLVRQWVLGAYAVWLQLRPAWLNDALRVMIPDDFMPSPVVQQLNAQAPGGRRPTLADMGPLRRMSMAFSVADDTATESSAPRRVEEARSEASPDSHPPAGAGGLHVSVTVV